MKVPFVDLQAQHRTLEVEMEAAFRRVLKSGKYILGEEVAAFERRLAEYTGARHAIGCASGTDALLMILQALGVGEGDEVAVPAFTFFATGSAVLQAGARPVFVDIDPHTFNLDHDRLREAASPLLKAVIAVHLFGRPTAIERIRPWCQERGVALVEDAAQALGARHGSSPVGSLGRAAAFSFFPTKNLGACGDGGAVTTDDAGVAERLRALRQHGRTGEYEHRFVGLNSRLDALQAAILGVKLEFLDGWNCARRENAERYARMFSERNLGRPGSGLVLPPPDPDGTVHQYVVRVEKERDALRRLLGEQEIGCAVYYPLPLHRQPALEGRGRQAGSLLESERASRESLALPVFPELTHQQQTAVVDAVQQGLRRLKV